MPQYTPPSTTIKGKYIHIQYYRNKHIYVESNTDVGNTFLK
jgi:hypothetical protein